MAPILLFLITIIHGGVELSFSMQINVPIQLSPTTTTSTCPSQENKERIKRYAIHLLEANGMLIGEKVDKNPCSCGGAGWTRVAYLNMSDPQQTCPSNWNLNTSPVRGCGRSSSGYVICDSVVYPVNSRSYSSVCGKITAYHSHISAGLSNFWQNDNLNIEEHYVSGLSITHGPPGARQHVWTFVGALTEQDNEFNGQYNCPCTNTTATWAYEIPTFIGNDYFCDTGNRGPGYNNTAFYRNDPLWDGEGCGSTSSCCEFNYPPWFCKSLPQPTTDDLEIRLCMHEAEPYEDKIITLMDIYVK